MTVPADPREALARFLRGCGWVGERTAAYDHIPLDEWEATQSREMADHLLANFPALAARQDEPSPALRSEILALAMMNTLPDVLDWDMHADEVIAEYDRLAANPPQTREAEA